MNSKIVLTIVIVSLQSTTVCCQLIDDGVHLVKRLNEFFRFDHNIFFMESSIDISRWFSSSAGIKLDNFTPQTVYTFDELSGNGPNITEQAIPSKNIFLVVVVERLQFENDSQLLAQLISIRKLDMNVKIGVFVAGKITSVDVVEKFFRWSWRVGIVNIFSAFRLYADDGDPSFNVFIYDPFGTFGVINVTRSESLQKYFPDKVPNYRQNRIAGAPVGGVSANVNFWKAVVYKFNASTSGTVENPLWLRYNYATQKIIQNDLQGFMYPHQQDRLSIIVPHARLYSGFVEYLQNGTWTLIFIYAAIVITLSAFLLVVSGYLQKKKIFLLQSVVDVVNLLINDNAGIRYRNLHPADACVIVPLTFAGLIAMNGILSNFQSYMTSPIYQPQMNTLEELYKSSVPFLVDDYSKGGLVDILEGLTEYGGWSARLCVDKNNVLAEEMLRFNNSIAFFRGSSDTHVFLEAQKRLGLKAYHLLSGKFLYKLLVSYEVGPDYPFTESIDDILHRLNGAGLIDKWWNERNDGLIKNLWKKHRNPQIRNESDMSGSAVTTVIWCGWIAGVIVFICELIWNNARSSYKFTTFLACTM